MSDIFGYQRSSKAPGSILTGEFGLLDIGGRVALVQQTTVNYSQEIQPVREVGSSDIYFVTGNPIGNMQVTRGVGPDGIWKHFGLNGNCGYLQTATVSTQSGKSCVSTSANGRLMMRDIFIQSVGFTMQAGMAQLTENVSAQFASITN